MQRRFERKKRTSFDQYRIFLKSLEKDEIFRTGVIPKDVNPQYLNNKWTDLAKELNNCGSGPQLPASGWKKRFLDWRNTARAKYRRIQESSGEVLTVLERKALHVWAPLTYKHFLEKDKLITDNGLDSSTSNLDSEVTIDDTKFHLQHFESLSKDDGESSKTCHFDDDVEDEKQCNGIYREPQTQTPLQGLDITELTAQLRRIANAKEEQLKFEIAKFKYRNPGFQYEYHPETRR